MKKKLFLYDCFEKTQHKSMLWSLVKVSFSINLDSLSLSLSVTHTLVSVVLDHHSNKNWLALQISMLNQSVTNNILIVCVRTRARAREKITLLLTYTPAYMGFLYLDARTHAHTHPAVRRATATTPKPQTDKNMDDDLKSSGFCISDVITKVINIISCDLQSNVSINICRRNRF